MSRGGEEEKYEGSGGEKKKSQRSILLTIICEPDCAELQNNLELLVSKPLQDIKSVGTHTNRSGYSLEQKVNRSKDTGGELNTWHAAWTACTELWPIHYSSAAEMNHKMQPPPKKKKHSWASVTNITHQSGITCVAVVGHFFKLLPVCCLSFAFGLATDISGQRLGLWLYVMKSQTSVSATVGLADRHTGWHLQGLICLFLFLELILHNFIASKFIVQ